MRDIGKICLKNSFCGSYHNVNDPFAPILVTDGLNSQMNTSKDYQQNWFGIANALLKSFFVILIKSVILST